MAIAKLYVDLLSVICPHCGEPLPNPDNGAAGWTPGEVETAARTNAMVDCPGCRWEVKLPWPKTVRLRQ
jgi:endogenous inhibitor of DNA gyrase (YacG/DUF329 family)